MRERLPTAVSGVPFRDNLFGVLALASVGLLCVLVILSGAVAIVARSVGTWEALFLMEQAFALSIPAVKVLLGCSVVAGAVFLWRN